MDIVTKNLLKTFQTEESLLSDIEESVLFEHFANFCILAKEYSEEFSLENIHTGDGGDMAIDGIAILVNGSLVSNIRPVRNINRSRNLAETSYSSFLN